MYTFCKVRGAKVVVGFFNNEPRYLDLVLGALERATYVDAEDQPDWHVSYVLLLWLSHLLLAPFDLATISSNQAKSGTLSALDLQDDVPAIARRVIAVGFSYITSSTKAQDATASMLVRLASRPDMQVVQLPQKLVTWALQQLETDSIENTVMIHNRVGPLRFLAGMSLAAGSAEFGHLLPPIYRMCLKISESSAGSEASAVEKKVIIKIFRNIALISLRPASGPLLSFLEVTSVLEEVIDFLLLSLADRDTPVRYAASKAIGNIVLELEDEMGHEVIQAVLDIFKEDVPKDRTTFDVRAVNPLRWHGLTLALAHVLFKRSASPAQLEDIIEALLLALNFEQRTATGSSVGTNVRDAACFGIWSLSRRYTTAELLSVTQLRVSISNQHASDISVPQALAIQVLLSATLDPAGNIRRGSSAALQELIGRHPNQVHEGISLVQIVDYQAVGLRRRAMVDVACKAADLHAMYWSALVDGLLGWRGVGSSDVASRDSAASALGLLSVLSKAIQTGTLVQNVLKAVGRTPHHDTEMLHGLYLSLSYILDEARSGHTSGQQTFNASTMQQVWQVFSRDSLALHDYPSRALRAQLPTAVARLLSSLSRGSLVSRDANEMCSDASVLSDRQPPYRPDLRGVEAVLERLLARSEEPVLQMVPSVVKAVLSLKLELDVSLGALEFQDLIHRVRLDGERTTLSGAGRAIALGTLYDPYTSSARVVTKPDDLPPPNSVYPPPLIHEYNDHEKAIRIVTVLTELVTAKNVDWRVVGLRSLQLAIEGTGNLLKDVSSPPNAPKIGQVTAILVTALHQGLNDYTVDERGDVGSLVRLQAIECTSVLWDMHPTIEDSEGQPVLLSDMLRLSFEKMDRVRLRAAQSLSKQKACGKVGNNPKDLDISSLAYFNHMLRPLQTSECAWQRTAIWHGCVSCCGISAEPLLQSSRTALAEVLSSMQPAALNENMSTFAAVLKYLLEGGGNIHPALELLAFLLDMQIPQRLRGTDFKWVLHNRMRVNDY